MFPKVLGKPRKTREENVCNLEKRKRPLEGITSKAFIWCTQEESNLHGVAPTRT